ncbi:hypothetical protein LTR53_018427, partial [Teratosphaeriaceae sp. CCFEE 6253]
MPKEYMGYAISPHIGPQYATQHQQMQVPAITLRDPPQRPRRVTPDLQPPMMNGKHNSRSPSPLGHLRSYSTIADLRSRSQAQAQSQMAGYEMIADLRARSQVLALQNPASQQTQAIQSPAQYDMASPVAMPPPVEREMGGPLIVNGSTPAVLPKPAESSNGVLTPSRSEEANGTSATEHDLSRIRSLPLRTTALDRYAIPERTDSTERSTSPQRISPS